MKQKRRYQINERVSRSRSILLSDRCYAYIKPLLLKLNQQLDRRLVCTFLGLLVAIIMHRHRNHGLLLSELGSYLLSPAQAPAGTKRLSNLLHSPRWSSKMIEDFLQEQANQRVQELSQQGEQALVIWDESVIEKPESITLEGLCPVRSRKAVRLKRIKPGYFNPPGGRPIFVPGTHWLQVLVTGFKGSVTVAFMRWWTTRGALASQRRSQEQVVLSQTAQMWGSNVLHIWDRGFAGRPWLEIAFKHNVHFVMRWPKGNNLLDEDGRLRKAWQIGRGKRSWDHRMLWDARRRCHRKTGVVAIPVRDDIHQHPLWLVISRPGKGREPWYLLTTKPIRSIDDAWKIVFAYARRWRIEETIRHTKCELSFESPRVQAWETRLKLLLIATLAYAFLLHLLDPFFAELIEWLLRNWCHRTGKRNRKTQVPFYRMRIALSRLWLTHPPPALPI